MRNGSISASHTPDWPCGGNNWSDSVLCYQALVLSRLGGSNASSAYTMFYLPIGLYGVIMTRTICIDHLLRVPHLCYPVSRCAPEPSMIMRPTLSTLTYEGSSIVPCREGQWVLVLLGVFMPWASVYELARCILHGEGTTKWGSQSPVSFSLVWLFFQPDRPHHVYVPGWRHFATWTLSSPHGRRSSSNWCLVTRC